MKNSAVSPVVSSVLTDIEFLSGIVSSTIRNVVLHPVQLCVVFREIDIDEYYIPSDVSEGEGTDIENIVQSWTWDTVVLPYVQQLTVSSGGTGNDDTRGGGCGSQGFTKEDFVWTIDTPDGVTLGQLTEAVYRVKGSKYDWWYELFAGITKKSFNDGHLVVNVTFDYGS